MPAVAGPRPSERPSARNERPEWISGQWVRIEEMLPSDASILRGTWLHVKTRFDNEEVIVVAKQDGNGWFVICSEDRVMTGGREHLWTPSVALGDRGRMGPVIQWRVRDVRGAVLRSAMTDDQIIRDRAGPTLSTLLNYPTRPTIRGEILAATGLYPPDEVPNDSIKPWLADKLRERAANMDRCWMPEPPPATPPVPVPPPAGALATPAPAGTQEPSQLAAAIAAVSTAAAQIQENAPAAPAAPEAPPLPTLLWSVQVERSGTEYGSASYSASFTELAYVTLNENDLRDFFVGAELDGIQYHDRDELLAAVAEMIEERGRSQGFRDRDTREFSYDDESRGGDSDDVLEAADGGSFAFLLDQFLERHPRFMPQPPVYDPEDDNPDENDLDDDEPNEEEIQIMTELANGGAAPTTPTAPTAPTPESAPAAPAAPTDTFAPAVPTADQGAIWHTVPTFTPPIFRNTAEVIRQATERIESAFLENVRRREEQERQEALNEIQPMPFPGN